VGSIDQPVEQLTNLIGLSAKLLTYEGEVNNHPICILIDGGSMGDFISDKVVDKLDLETRVVMGFSILFPNGQTSPCNKEIIDTCLHIQEHCEMIHPKVILLPHHDLILGKPWLEKWNPHINWHSNHIHITQGKEVVTLNQMQGKSTPLLVKKLQQEVIIPK
jgi:Retroviral aspartyl protease